MSGDPNRFSEAYLTRLLQELHRQDIARAGRVLGLRLLSWGLARAAAGPAAGRTWHGTSDPPAGEPQQQLEPGDPLPVGFTVELRVSGADAHARVVVPITDVRCPLYRWLEGKAVRLAWVVAGEPAESEPVVLRRSRAAGPSHGRPAPAVVLESGFVRLIGMSAADADLANTLFGVRYGGELGTEG